MQARFALPYKGRARRIDSSEADRRSGGDLSALLRFVAGELGAEQAILALLDDGSSNGRRLISAPARDGSPGTAPVDDRLAELLPTTDRAMLVPLAGVPVALAGAPVANGGPAKGMLYLAFPEALTYDEDTVLRALRSYADVIAVWLDDPATVTGLMEAAYRDPLTSCLTYSALTHALDEEVRRSERYGAPFSCCFIDLDGFKAINDTDGHEMGNRVLAAVGHTVVSRIRQVDFAGRYGGDEFVVGLPHTDAAHAGLLAAALRGEIRKATRQLLGRPVDVSIGIAEWSKGLNAAELLEQADRDLMRAKEHRGVTR